MFIYPKDFTPHHKMDEILDFPLEIVNELYANKLLSAVMSKSSNIPGYSTTDLIRIRKGKIRQVTEIIEEKCIDAKQAAQMMGCTPKWITVLAVKNEQLKPISFIYKGKWCFLKDKLELIIDLNAIRLKANAGKQLGPREKQAKQENLFKEKKGKTRKINEIDTKIIKNFLHNSVRITKNTEDKCSKSELFRLFQKAYMHITGDHVPFSNIIFNKYMVKHHGFKETEIIHNGSPHRYWVQIQIDKNLTYYTRPKYETEKPFSEINDDLSLVKHRLGINLEIEKPQHINCRCTPNDHDIGDSGITAKMHEADKRKLIDYHKDELDKLNNNQPIKPPGGHEVISEGYKPTEIICTEKEIDYKLQGNQALIMMELAVKGSRVAKDWLRKNGYKWVVDNINKHELWKAKLIIGSFLGCVAVLWIIMWLMFIGII